MSESLPAPIKLEKLPMRALVIYAARMALRLSLELHGIVPDDVLNDSLLLTESAATSCALEELDPETIIRGAQRITEAYAAAPESVKSPRKFLIVFSFVQAAFVAMDAIQAAGNPTRARYHMERAALAAHRAIRPLNALSTEARNAAIKAARRDYDILLREYGEHDEVVIGGPVHCFDADASQ